MILKTPNLLVTVICCSFGLGAAFDLFGEEPKPNVVFIAIDDLNDWIGCLGGHPDAQTPHLDQLAKNGTLFRNAHCQVPVCMGSRVSVFSGKLPSTTGCYEFNADFHEATSLERDVPIPMHFRRQGYTTIGGGKLLHSGFQGRLAESIEVVLSKGANPSPRRMMNWPIKVWDFGPFPERDEEMGDWQLAHQAAEFLNVQQTKPFFLAVGFHRPHVPMHVPQRWFDLYDREKIALPKAPREDLEDIPESDITRQKAIAPSHEQVVQANRWRDFVHAYLACISFVDHCVGVVAESALKGPNKENTILVLWSDHGFHLGEKQHWAKRTLWQESTRVPLIIAGKGIPKDQKVDTAVGLIDIYPTLVDLCRLPTPQEFDGLSLRPWIDRPSWTSHRAVVSTWLPNNHCVIQGPWRYLRYKEGTEELYQIEEDPNQWHNLALDPKFSEVKKELAKHLPSVNAELLHIAGKKERRE